MKKQTIICQYCSQSFLGDELNVSRESCNYCMQRNKPNKKKQTMKEKVKVLHLNLEAEVSRTKDNEKLNRFQKKQEIENSKEVDINWRNKING